MSKFAKGNLTVDGTSLHVSMPFEKVNEEKRTVSGYATLDNIDTQGDVVTAEASAKAFATARGNLREMHKKDSAVGRIVDFREDEYLDTNTGELYRGIFVTARVSEGAQDTWLKVLDGTLSGFSIGGEITEAETEFVKEAGRTVRFIKGYDLTELSLVDNPANQLANVSSIQKSIFSIQKADTGSVTVTGMVAETQIENVFICKNDETVIIKDVDTSDCPMCGKKMENAGWFEAGTDRAEKVRDIVTKFLSPSETEAAPNHSEGGVEMGTNDVEKGVRQPQSPKTDPNAKPEEVEEAETVEEVEEEKEETPKPKRRSRKKAAPKQEESADEETDEEETEESTPDEVTDEAEEISKKIDALHSAINDSLEKTRDETTEQVKALEKKIEEINESFTKKASELEGKFNEFGEKLETAKSRQASLEKALDAMNSSEAIRKSADVESAETHVQKSSTIWNGAFSGKPTGFSVDQL